MKFWLEVIGHWLVTIVLLIIGFIPNIFFQYMQWTENPSLDLLSRVIGFIMVLFIIVKLCNRND